MFLYPVRTSSAVEFTGAIVTNAQETENIVLPSSLSGINGNAANILHAIEIVATENLAYELDFYGSDAFNSATPNLNRFLGLWAFAAGDGTQVAATGLYRYYIDGLAIPLWDYDLSGELHVALVNRSVASKTAGAGGAMTVTMWCGVMGGGTA